MCDLAYEYLVTPVFNWTRHFFYSKKRSIISVEAGARRRLQLIRRRISRNKKPKKGKKTGRNWTKDRTSKGDWNYNLKKGEKKMSSWQFNHTRRRRRAGFLFFFNHRGFPLIFVLLPLTWTLEEQQQAVDVLSEEVVRASHREPRHNTKGIKKSGGHLSAELPPPPSKSSCIQHVNYKVPNTSKDEL